MFRQEYIIQNPMGLHARPASELVTYCKKIPVEISFYHDERKFNPKSIISILSGGLKQGTKITIEVSGENENQIGIELIAFLDALKE